MCPADSALPTYRYRVDGDDNLVAVDAWWLAFARENGATHLTEAFVRGRSLWGFIVDDATRSLYRELHTRIRKTRQTVVLPFRCDSPNLKRHMQLTITPAEDGCLDYRSTLLRVELQRQIPALDRTVLSSSRRLTLCSCCKKALLHEADWHPLEQVAAQLRLFESDAAPRLLYAVCPACRDLAAACGKNGHVA